MTEPPAARVAPPGEGGEMYRLTPQIMPYAWGSHRVLAELTGRPAPTGRPEAELWMGAHEQAPSTVSLKDGAVGLDKAIAADPGGMLGARTAASFGGRLPFLLKVLAPERPLSIQCHPSARQAAEAPAGTYGDSWPKPEALVALTDFQIFAGLRPFAQLRDIVARLGCTLLAAEVDAVGDGPRPAYNLLARLLRLPRTRQSALVQEVVTAARECHDDVTCDVIARFAGIFPGDIGLAVLLLMQHRKLGPGDYIFVPAGVLHAYVGGTVVEILANSDNVVRAGLTPKPIDIDELLRIVDPDARMEVARPTVDGRVSRFPSNTEYFELCTVAPGDDPVRVPGEPGPRILLALHGSQTLRCGDAELRLRPGESCFVPAGQSGLTAFGDGRLFVAGTGRAPS